MDDFVIFVIVVVIFIAMILCPIFMIDEQVAFWNAQVEIEQLRTDLQKVSVQESEDVIGQVTQWNQIIARKKMQNGILLWCLFVPNGWDRIEPLEIPSR